MNGSAALALVTVLGVLGSAAHAEAQDPASLERVEELVGQGRAEEARAVLMTWWSESAGSATRREAQRGLWLRGRLTVDPAQAELDFRRLVIEYPGGPYSDQALFRLAQSAYAAGDSLAAVGHVDRLAREYPSSASRREAEAWLATAGPAPPRIGDPLQRLLPGASSAPDSLAAEAATDPPPEDQPDAAVPRGQFTVQLGAFSSVERAEALRRRAADAGFEARLVTVQGSPLVRVRVGIFDEQAGADAILKRLQDRGFTAALARDAQSEERAVR
jgi:hypothetical protein